MLSTYTNQQVFTRCLFLLPWSLPDLSICTFLYPVPVLASLDCPGAPQVISSQHIFSWLILIWCPTCNIHTWLWMLLSKDKTNTLLWGAVCKCVFPSSPPPPPPPLHFSLSSLLSHFLTFTQLSKCSYLFVPVASKFVTKWLRLEEWFGHSIARNRTKLYIM